MRLLAIGDLHVGHPINREALADLSPHPDDWLILAGDMGETEEHLRIVLDHVVPRFAQVLWVPGNHELYTTQKDPLQLGGEPRYQHLVEVCRGYGVATPEDPWLRWPGDGPPTTVALAFVGYDYSFGPDGLDPAEAVAWARSNGIIAADERYVHPDPFQSRQDWCADRVAKTEARLAQIPDGHRLVFVNHWPLRRDLVRLFRIPGFLPWCGTRKTEDWHRRYPMDVVVSGHLHMRATDWRHGVRFEETALGYPRHWRQARGIDAYLREILPRVTAPLDGFGGPAWHH